MKDRYYFEELLDLSGDEREKLHELGFASVKDILNTTIIELSLLKGVYRLFVARVIEALAIWRGLENDKTIEKFEDEFIDNPVCYLDGEDLVTDYALEKYLSNNNLSTDFKLMNLTIKQLISLPEIDKDILYLITDRILEKYNESYMPPGKFVNRRDVIKNRQHIFLSQKRKLTH